MEPNFWNGGLPSRCKSGASARYGVIISEPLACRGADSRCGAILWDYATSIFVRGWRRVVSGLTLFRFTPASGVLVSR